MYSCDNSKNNKRYRNYGNVYQRKQWYVIKTQDCTPTTMFNCELLVIGNISEFTNRTLNGGIASLIIYNSVLSITDRQRIEGYLAWKWWGTGNAILQTSHPYYDVPIGDIGQLFNPITVS